MGTIRLTRILTALIAAALWTFLSPAAAFNNIDLEFDELPGNAGVTFTETVNGSLTNQFTVPGETVSLVVGPGGNASGDIFSTTPLLVNLLEPDGITISDQIQVFTCPDVSCSSGLALTFTSAPATFVTGSGGAVLEVDGILQSVVSYSNSQGFVTNEVSVFVTSQPELAASVPEPTTLALLGLGLAGLGFARRKIGK